MPHLEKKKPASEGIFTPHRPCCSHPCNGRNSEEMAETIKELKNSAAKPSEENETPTRGILLLLERGSKQKGPSFVTQEDVIAML
ncbi:hypothetical protein L3X38_011408 [Prunus dulcis]|uniref:Uncharacterized protein n=1 Tax=Prunus dulcis TaxID=3755 RepID=A0AAD4WK53_PRUDU|nr:hypothetical protein L3X38_011408 [Prunus dulcis]